MTFPSFDTELLLYINQCNNALLDGVMVKLTDDFVIESIAISNVQSDGVGVTVENSLVAICDTALPSASKAMQ